MASSSPVWRILVAGELADADKQKSVLLEYSKAFEAAYQRPPDHFGGHAWDAMHMIAAALKTAGPDPKKIRDALETSKDFVGISGIFTLSAT